jgi:diguanylate cyclase (GGDEF)-like protein/PAS domain S-box-containing protein
MTTKTFSGLATNHGASGCMAVKKLATSKRGPDDVSRATLVDDILPLGAGPEGPLQTLVQLLPQAVFQKDRQGRISFANRAFCRLADRLLEDILGRADVDVLPSEHVEQARLDDRRALDSGEIFEAEYESSSAPGRIWRVLRVPLRGVATDIQGFWGVLWDVSDGHRQKEALEQELFLFKTLMDTLPDSIYFKDKDSRFSWVNRHTLDKFGVPSLADVVGKTDFDIFTGEHAARAFRDEQEIIRTERPLVNVEEKETLADGRVRWVSTTKMPLRDAQGRVVGSFGMSRDITERKLAEEQLAHQAFYDGLTKLPNRALFMNRLEHLLRRTRRRVGKRFLFAVIYLDVDRFKGVNDSLGHQTGDDLLIQVARRLETCLRPGDTLARLGGDEFTVLLEDIRSETDATRVAERIHQALTEPFNVAGTEIFCSVSVGIALSSTGYTRPEEMLRDADTAMYRAKSNGRSRHEVFDADMHRRAVALLQLETDLRRALERNECRVYYQPVVALHSRQLTGVEALIRWQHPHRGMVMPDVFIPMAEETGLIGPLGIWVLREACRQMKDWHTRFPQQPPLLVSVNMSTRQLAQPDLVERVQAILDETQLDPRTLVLEITESAIMQNLKAGAEVIRRLHELGVRFNIDDFGTGYSSLSYLQSFPVDTLKVDRSFISRMNSERGQCEIVRAIVALAQNLGIAVTAEGVETVEQITALLALNCDSAQGFFFAPPLPAAEVEKLIVRGVLP